MGDVSCASYVEYLVLVGADDKVLLGGSDDSCIYCPGLIALIGSSNLEQESRLSVIVLSQECERAVVVFTDGVRGHFCSFVGLVFVIRGWCGCPTLPFTFYCSTIFAGVQACWLPEAPHGQWLLLRGLRGLFSCWLLVPFLADS